MEGLVALLGVSLVGPNRRPIGDLGARPCPGGGTGRSARRHRCALAPTGGHTQAHTAETQAGRLAMGLQAGAHDVTAEP